MRIMHGHLGEVSVSRTSERMWEDEVPWLSPFLLQGLGMELLSPLLGHTHQGRVVDVAMALIVRPKGFQRAGDPLAATNPVTGCHHLVHVAEHALGAGHWLCWLPNVLCGEKTPSQCRETCARLLRTRSCCIAPASLGRRRCADFFATAPALGQPPLYPRWRLHGFPSSSWNLLLVEPWEPCHRFAILCRSVPFL